jgi:phage terminase large subunit-like protein
LILKIYDNPGITRRAIISFGRKNGKTALSSFLTLLHLVGPEARPNGQCYSVAQSRDQAAILFKLAAKCIRLSPTLCDFVGIRDTVKELYCQELGTLYSALSAEASTAMGKSPCFIVHDELGQVKGPTSELYDAMETATAAHNNPLSVIISTQAPTDGALLSVLIDDAIEGHDPKTVVCLYTAPDDLDPFSEEAIRAANPAFGDFQNATEVLDMAETAKRMPSRESSYRNLVLNQRIDANNPFVSRSVWDQCAAKPMPFGTYPVYGGLDLSTTTDLTSLVLVCPIDGIYNVNATFWLPSDDLRERSKRDRVPYDVWAREGHITTTPGKSIEYEWVAYRLREVFDTYNIAGIAFDRWNMSHLKPWLVHAGFKPDEIERFVDFGQGFKSMTPALTMLENDLLNGKIAHGGHPVLRMCAANAVVQSDPAGNRKLAKNKSTGRIDGMVALAMARSTVTTAKVKPKRFVTGRLVFS